MGYLGNETTGKTSMRIRSNASSLLGVHSTLNSGRAENALRCYTRTLDFGHEVAWKT